eukprot:1066709-Rhodomonas_salina.1
MAVPDYLQNTIWGKVGRGLIVRFFEEVQLCYCLRSRYEMSVECDHDDKKARREERGSPSGTVLCTGQRFLCVTGTERAVRKCGRGSNSS